MAWSVACRNTFPRLFAQKKSSSFVKAFLNIGKERCFSFCCFFLQSVSRCICHNRAHHKLKSNLRRVFFCVVTAPQAACVCLQHKSKNTVDTEFLSATECNTHRNAVCLFVSSLTILYLHWATQIVLSSSCQLSENRLELTISAPTTYNTKEVDKLQISRAGQCVEKLSEWWDK